MMTKREENGTLHVARRFAIAAYSARPKNTTTHDVFRGGTNAVQSIRQDFKSPSIGQAQSL